MASPGELVKDFLAHRDVLFGYVLALTHDQEAAEEVFQEAGLAIVEEASKGTRVARFLPWAHEILRRRTAEYYRKGSRRRKVEQSETMEVAVSQAFIEYDEEAEGGLRECLAQCMDGLTGRGRELIEGRYRDRRSIREMASSLSWTEDSVKSALWKTRKLLADCVEGRMRLREGP